MNIEVHSRHFFGSLMLMCPSWEGTSVRRTWPLADPNLNP